MTPKEILVLLDIIEASAKSTAYSHITGAAHEALTHARLNVLSGNDKEEKEAHSPPTKKKGE
jgi:hypothetical protein